MHVKCALWDVEYGRVTSEWEEAEMFADTHEGVTRFHNAKEFMFRVNATGPWSGHMITILPGDSNRPFISKVNTITILPG